MLRIVHGEYGRGYSHETPRAREAARALADGYGITADATYSAKALAAAIGAPGDGPTLFWMTFDAWWTRQAGGAADAGGAGGAGG